MRIIQAPQFVSSWLCNAMQPCIAGALLWVSLLVSLFIPVSVCLHGFSRLIGLQSWYQMPPTKNAVGWFRRKLHCVDLLRTCRITCRATHAATSLYDGVYLKLNYSNFWPASCSSALVTRCKSVDEFNELGLILIFSVEVVMHTQQSRSVR